MTLMSSSLTATGSFSGYAGLNSLSASRGAPATQCQ
jgi:hypothetical protein